MIKIGEPIKYEFGQELIIKVPGHKQIKGYYFRHKLPDIGDDPRTDEVFMYTMSDEPCVILVREKYIFDESYPFYNRVILLEKTVKGELSRMERNDLMNTVLDLLISIKGGENNFKKIRPTKFFKTKKFFTRLINKIKNRLKSK